MCFNVAWNGLLGIGADDYPICTKNIAKRALSKQCTLLEMLLNPSNDMVVLALYGKYGATQLERLTHSEQPWIQARRGLSPDEPSRNVIPKNHMRL